MNPSKSTTSMEQDTGNAKERNADELLLDEVTCSAKYYKNDS